MSVTKVIGMIFLAVWLILTGMATMTEIQMMPMAGKFIDLIGVASGVLILVSIGRFTQHKR